MLRILQKEYYSYVKNLREKYAARILPLQEKMLSDYDRFIDNRLPLYVHVKSKKGIRLVTLQTIWNDLFYASQNGIHFVEYKVNTYLYQSWIGDNVNVFLGKYVLQPESLQIPGAPSYLRVLKHVFADLIVTYTEETSTGILRIEMPVCPYARMRLNYKLGDFRKFV